MIFQCILATQPPLTEALSCGLQSLVYFKTHHPNKYETCQIGFSSMHKTSLSTVQKSSVLCLQKCTNGPMNNSKFARLHIIAKKTRGQQTCTAIAPRGSGPRGCRESTATYTGTCEPSQDWRGARHRFTLSRLLRHSAIVLELYFLLLRFLLVRECNMT